MRVGNDCDSIFDLMSLIDSVWKWSKEASKAASQMLSASEISESDPAPPDAITGIETIDLTWDNISKS